MSRMLSYYKSQLKSAAKSGPQYVTIADVKVFINEKGNPIQNNGRSGIVMMYKNENIEHEELYWNNIKDNNRLIKLMELLSIERDSPELFPYLNKKLWIVIRHNILIDDKQNEVKRESEIVHYSADEATAPNYPTVFEEYDIAAV